MKILLTLIFLYFQNKDAGKFLFKIQDPEGTVKAAAETAMREVTARSNIQPILTEGRSQIEIDQEIIQNILDEYNSGIQITQVQTQKLTHQIKL